MKWISNSSGVMAASRSMVCRMLGAISGSYVIPYQSASHPCISAISADCAWTMLSHIARSSG